MATSSTNKTIWTVGLLALLAFVVWWYIKRRGGSQAYSGGGAVSPGSYYAAPENGMPQSSRGLSFGNGSGAGSGSSSQKALNNFLSGVNAYNQQSQGMFEQALLNSETQALVGQPNSVGPFTQGPFADISSLWDQATGQYDLQNLDNLPSWSPDDPSAPWNSDDENSDGLSVADTSATYIPASEDSDSLMAPGDFISSSDDGSSASYGMLDSGFGSPVDSSDYDGGDDGLDSGGGDDDSDPGDYSGD